MNSKYRHLDSPTYRSEFLFRGRQTPEACGPMWLGIVASRLTQLSNPCPSHASLVLGSPPTRTRQSSQMERLAASSDAAFRIFPRADSNQPFNHIAKARSLSPSPNPAKGNHFSRDHQNPETSFPLPSRPITRKISDTFLAQTGPNQKRINNEKRNADQHIPIGRNPNCDGRKQPARRVVYRTSQPG